jgi:hypothetical protein
MQAFYSWHFFSFLGNLNAVANENYATFDANNARKYFENYSGPESIKLLNFNGRAVK